jgi:MFS family permease
VTLRNRTFGALLAAEAISTTGAQMTWVALPWFVLTTTGSPAQMTAVMAAELLGVAVFGLPGAALLRRLGARSTLLLCDALRAPLMLLLPALYWLDALTLGPIVVVAFLLGALGVFWFPAQRLIVPELFGDDEQLVSRANALLQAAVRTTLLLGPPLAGLLIAWLSAPAVLVVDAATYVVSFVLVAAFVPSRARPAPTEEERGLLVGFRFLLRHRLLRPWSIALIAGDTAWQAFFAAIPVLVLASFGEDARVAGLLLAAFGAGAVLGNLIAYRAAARVDGLQLIGTVALGQALPLWLLAFDVPVWALFAAIAASGFANGLINPALHTLITLKVPEALRPKVMAAWATALGLAAPLGLVFAGPVLELVGATPVLVAVAAVQTVCMGALALAALRETRVTVPEPAT